MRLSGEFKVILGASLFSFIPVGVKLDPASSIIALIFGRLLVSSVVLALLNRKNRDFFFVQNQQVRHLFFWAGLMLIAMLSYYYAINSIGVAMSSALLGTQPLILVLLAFIFLKERITLKIGIAALMTISGILCLANVGTIEARGFSIGQLSALLSAVSLGFVFIYQKKYLMDIEAQQSVFFQSLFQLPFLAPLLAFFVPVPSINYVSASLLLGIVCTVMAYGFIYSGVKELPVQKVGILQSVEYVIPVIIGVFCYNESLTLSGCLGVGIILAACVLVQLNVGVERSARNVNA